MAACSALHNAPNSSFITSVASPGVGKAAAASTNNESALLKACPWFIDGYCRSFSLSKWGNRDSSFVDPHRQLLPWLEIGAGIE